MPANTIPAKTNGAPVPSAIEIDGFTPAQVELMKNTICKGATDDELKLFGYVANKKRLDPFSKQIHAVKRKQYDEESDQWKDVMSFQVAIDGFRLIADRTGKYEGQAPIMWCGPDGVWKDLWLDAGFPTAAKATVYRTGFREPMVRIAKWVEYVQKKRNGDPFKMWKTMPANQLGKCAEAAALRAAFPEECSDLYEPAELDHLDSEEAQKPIASLPAPDNAQVVAGYVIPTKAEPVPEPVPTLPHQAKAPEPAPAPQAAPVEAPKPATPPAPVEETPVAKLRRLYSETSATLGYNEADGIKAINAYLRGVCNLAKQGPMPKTPEAFLAPLAQLTNLIAFDPSVKDDFTADPFVLGAALRISQPAKQSLKTGLAAALVCKVREITPDDLNAWMANLNADKLPEDDLRAMYVLATKTKDIAGIVPSGIGPAKVLANVIVRIGGDVANSTKEAVDDAIAAALASKEQ